jgi:hypothetical protein
MLTQLLCECLHSTHIEKHLHDRIISLSFHQQGVLAHKSHIASTTQPLFLFKLGKWAVLYMWVRGFLLFLRLFYVILDFGTVLTTWYFFCFLLYLYPFYFSIYGFWLPLWYLQNLLTQQMNWLQDKLESIILINCKIHNNQSAGEVVINKLSESTTFLPIYYTVIKTWHWWQILCNMSFIEITSYLKNICTIAISQYI